MSAPDSTPGGVDPRGLRVTAGVTAALLLVVVVLAAAGAALAAWVLLALVSATFLVGAVGGVRRAPLGVVFRVLVRPRIGAPAELEGPRPPTFAQAVGFAVTVVGVVLGAIGVPLAVPIAAAAAFVAAFLNVAFGFCLGCELYLLLARVRAARA